MVRQLSQLPEVWRHVRAELDAGRQGYVVYPRLNDAQCDVKAVTEEFPALAKRFHPHPVAMLHGETEDKERVMAQFAAGEIKLLATTSVIEVKPITINPIYARIDVHIKVDKELDSFFDFEKTIQPEQPKKDPGSPGSPGSNGKAGAP